MFSPVVKTVRALFGAIALTLLGVGVHGVRLEHESARTEAAWAMAKRVKPAMIFSARAGSACPLASAAQAVPARALTPPLALDFLALAGPAENGATNVLAARGPERQSRARTTPGVVRLLI